MERFAPTAAPAIDAGHPVGPAEPVSCSTAAKNSKACSENYRWCGRVKTSSSSASSDSPVYHAILTVHNATLHVCLTDADCTFTASMSLNAQPTEPPSHPQVAKVTDNNKKLALLISALDEVGANNTHMRVHDFGDDGRKQLHISTRWGVEYEHFAIDLDIMAIPLISHPRNSLFLQTVFNNLKDTRNRIELASEENRNLDFEIDDIQQAQKRLDYSHKSRIDRIHVFLNALNQYKRTCEAHHTLLK